MFLIIRQLTEATTEGMNIALLVTLANAHTFNELLPRASGSCDFEVLIFYLVQIYTQV